MPEPHPARQADTSTTAPAVLLESLFRELYDPLRRFAYRYTRSRAAAEDVVHEVFLAVWQVMRRGQWNEVANPRAYLYRAVRHASARAARLSRRERASSLELAAQVPDPGSVALPASERDDQEADAVLQRTLGRLPERCRLVFALSREHGLTYAEIAAALDISHKTVEAHMTRALSALRQALDGYLP